MGPNAHIQSDLNLIVPVLRVWFDSRGDAHLFDGVDGSGGGGGKLSSRPLASHHFVVKSGREREMSSETNTRRVRLSLSQYVFVVLL